MDDAGFEFLYKFESLEANSLMPGTRFRSDDADLISEESLRGFKCLKDE